MPRCSAKTKAGARCRRQAVEGEQLCASHLGTAHRPSKITEAGPRIVQAIRAGNYNDTAAAYGSVDPSTFYRWMEVGEADLQHERDTEYRKFYEDVKKALADAEVYAVGIVRQAMPGDWKAAMTYLERKFPDRWGRRERFEHTGRDGGPIEVADGLQDPEVRRRARELIARIEAARSAEPGGSGSGD